MFIYFINVVIDWYYDKLLKFIALLCVTCVFFCNLKKTTYMYTWKYRKVMTTDLLCTYRKNTDAKHGFVAINYVFIKSM